MPQPFSHQKLVKRFSQISGIPIREFMPKVVPKRRDSSALGYYDAENHTIYPSNDKGIARHELRHTINNLANPKRRSQINTLSKLERCKLPRKTKKRILKKTYKKIVKGIKKEHTIYDEPIVKIPGEKTKYRLLAATKIPGLLELTATMGAGYLVGSKMLPIGYLVAKFINGMRRNKNVERVIKNHGEDGALLLWATFPAGEDTLKVAKWEKEMIQKGYLLPKSGMTKKGLQLWREKVSPQSIRTYLENAKRKQRKQLTKIYDYQQ